MSSLLYLWELKTCVADRWCCFENMLIWAGIQCASTPVALTQRFAAVIIFSTFFGGASSPMRWEVLSPFYRWVCGGFIWPDLKFHVHLTRTVASSSLNPPNMMEGPSGSPNPPQPSLGTNWYKQRKIMSISLKITGSAGSLQGTLCPDGHGDPWLTAGL